MARMITKFDSTAQHLRMGRRHARLCGRVSGAKKFPVALQPELDKLKEQKKNREKAVENKEDAYDDVIYCDIQLDNAIRTAFERVRQWDRDNNSRILDMVFPNRIYSDIVRMPLSKEPVEAAKLPKRLETLEDGHELRQLAAPLRQCIDASRAAWNVYQQATEQLKDLQTDEELAKAAVRQQYEHNYLDARKEFGAAVADSIFPRISRKPVVSPDEEPQIVEEKSEE